MKCKDCKYWKEYKKKFSMLNNVKMCENEEVKDQMIYNDSGTYQPLFNTCRDFGCEYGEEKRKDE
jgi:hypothetical protein